MIFNSKKIPKYSEPDQMMHRNRSSFRIPYHYRFSMGTFQLKNDPYTYTVSGGNGRVYSLFAIVGL